tara:strand:- start:1445 stop:1639 length:195 start_codon:yes stop_codon:yes gene_type:complete
LVTWEICWEINNIFFDFFARNVGGVKIPLNKGLLNNIEITSDILDKDGEFTDDVKEQIKNMMAM